MNYYRQRKVKAIHGGFIAMRRRSGANWIRIDEMPVSASRPFGDFVMQMFAGRDFLQANSSDEQMLAARPKISADARLDQQLRPSPVGWQPASFMLRLSSGLPFSIAVQPLVAEFIG